MTRYLIGTGGWGYFNVPSKYPLKIYSEIFNFVEVNYTFYKYPRIERVEYWRRITPKNFTFTVRCHQDLTHRIGLKPIEESYEILDKMIIICNILRAPILHLVTPNHCILNRKAIQQADDFFSSLNLKNLRLAWEIRSHTAENLFEIMEKHNIIPSVDLSKTNFTLKTKIVYSRLFGKGLKNLYQFTDDELKAIDKKIFESKTEKVYLTFHGVRMNADALRFLKYKNTGVFPTATNYVGIDSVKSVLMEDAKFPITKSKLIVNQGWKVIDLTLDKRVHLSTLLNYIPDKTYVSLTEVLSEVETYL